MTCRSWSGTGGMQMICSGDQKENKKKGKGITFTREHNHDLSRGVQLHSRNCCHLHCRLPSKPKTHRVLSTQCASRSARDASCLQPSPPLPSGSNSSGKVGSQSSRVHWVQRFCFRGRSRSKLIPEVMDPVSQKTCAPTSRKGSSIPFRE